MTVDLRQNVYWQNISPANGRQFTSADVVYNYCRLFGLGDGFSTPGIQDTGEPLYPILTSITATDKFTVVFQFSTTNVENILESVEALNECPIVAPEVIQTYGNASNWHNAIGTGPFILSDFVDDTSLTLTKNPNYWGYDERYPQNKLPYVNGVQILIIPNQTTGLAALRSGKIDVMEGLSLQSSQGLTQTNPSILQITLPDTTALSVVPRNDKAPFNNINVRIALQEAINLPQIASTYYEGTCSPDPQTLTSYQMTGWGLPYNEWSSALQAQYAYNPTNAKSLLAAAGFPNGFNTDCIADGSGDLTLLQIVQSEFAAIGVNMSINTMTSAAFTSYVVTGHNQDALAYRSQGTLGLSYQPLMQFAMYYSGHLTNYTLPHDANYDALYVQAQAATSTDQVKTLLTEACQMVTQQQFVVSLLNPSSFNAYQPWLKGYSGQSFAMTGGTDGPLMLGFYGARFWIDQNLMP
jgi:peptide/nickel transport system substrate-binding protein